MDMRLYKIDKNGNGQGKTQIELPNNSDLLPLGKDLELKPSQICELRKILVSEVKESTQEPEGRIKKIDRSFRSYLGIDAVTKREGYPLLTDAEKNFIKSILGESTQINNNYEYGPKKMALSEKLGWIGIITTDSGGEGEQYILLCGEDKGENLVKFAMQLLSVVLTKPDQEYICDTICDSKSQQ